MLQDVLARWECKEVDALHVYSTIFRLGDGYIQRSGELRTMQGNPLVYMKNRDYVKGKYRVLLEDTFEETLRESQEADFAIVNGISYFGRKNLQAAAHKMYAMIFDLDGQTDQTLNDFMSGAVGGVYPLPNYVALSGHGVHLYYLFDEPIPLYPNIKIQLKELKYALTTKMWNAYTSTDDKPQYQGINQGFRPIGGKTKVEGVRVRAFETSAHPYTIKQLYEYVSELVKIEIDEQKLYRESKLSLAEAAKKYPQWYEKRIVNGDKSRGHWVCKRDLYEWWKRQIASGAVFHHRYFDVMCLAIYAVKCGISEDEVRKDADSLIPFLNAIHPEDPFTEADVESALECFDERYFTFPRDDIARLSGIVIHANKRNGRSRAAHIRIMNFIRDEVNENVNWHGRKSKKSDVLMWRQLHPKGIKADCIRDTGMDRKTVSKYWDVAE